VSVSRYWTGIASEHHAGNLRAISFASIEHPPEGPGLAIDERLVQAHWTARSWVTANPDGHFYVPAADGQIYKYFEAPKVGAQMAEQERILVVDDEPSIRKYLGTLLEVDGYQVETVVSGLEAIEKIQAGDRPDFIILDVLMPDLNGLETLKQLMQIDHSLNVVMLSCSK